MATQQSDVFVGDEPETKGPIVDRLPVSFEGLLLAPSVLVLGILSIVPLIALLWLSAMEVNFLPGHEPTFVGLENYQAMFNSTVANSWKVTVFYIVGALSLQITLGTAIALLLDRVSRGENVLTGIIIMPMMIAPVVVGLLWQFLLDPSFGLYTWLLNQIGLFTESPILGSQPSALIAVIVMDTWQWTPLVVLIVLAGLKAVPRQLYEAARVDGATFWTEFRYVTLPMLKPALAIALLLRSMDLIRYFTKIFITTGGGPASSTKIIGFLVYEESLRFYNLGYGAAMGIGMLIVTVLLGIFFTESVMGGAGDDA
ncbi:carbohydrate ABC transporter permease [Natrinema salifodinae]|uniref:Carbohydrate ABC transporter membrane protein 1, CUT1 family n=1 Tax=Natrinema salifodinae TaxID=1202768 RepID=A0A1I0P996_9EURY|nr:sugar ABC transporter permease [Natrinema salifodinae]SEW10973.1 carbohydrate ABC transporter membrane protein 1, CUT1 family [Natrinema salifodinae]